MTDTRRLSRLLQNQKYRINHRSLIKLKRGLVRTARNHRSDIPANSTSHFIKKKRKGISTTRTREGLGSEKKKEEVGEES